MKLQFSDWKRAGLLASILLGPALFGAFGVQHGFEEGVAWYLMLLPASIVAAPISDAFNKAPTRQESVVFWVLLVCFNFFWYFGISYAVLKAYRFFSGTSKIS